MFKVSACIYVLFFFCLTPLCLLSQTVEWSNQVKVKSKTNYSQVLGENSTGVYMVRCRTNDFRRDIVVEKYKPNLVLELSQDLPLPTNNILEKLVLLENSLLLFTSGKNYNSGKVELSCIRLDLYFKPVNTPTIICEVDANRFKDNSNFYIKSSGDKSKFVVMYIQASDKLKSQLNFIGLNDQLVSIYKRETTIDYEVSDVFFSSMECNNEGDVFAIIDFPKDIKKNRDNDPRKFFMYAYFQSLETIIPYELGKDSVFINDIGLAVNNFNKSVTVTGFYSHAHDNHVVGDFFYNIDALSSLVKVKKFEDFPKSFVAKVASNMQNESSPNLSDIYIRKIIPRSDGGCLTISEKYYETKQSYTFYVNGFPQTSYRVVYNFDEIIFISRDAKGVIQFKDYIKKNQNSMSDGGYYSSFVTVTGNDKIGVIYNSDANNEGDVMMSTISNKGIIDTKVLIKALTYFVLLMPNESKQISANSSLICTLKDKRFSIMRLTF